MPESIPIQPRFPPVNARLRGAIRCLNSAWSAAPWTPIAIWRAPRRSRRRPHAIRGQNAQRLGQPESPHTRTWAKHTTAVAIGLAAGVIIHVPRSSTGADGALMEHLV